MMRCDQAQQFFNAYLDGDLAPSLAMELSAHRLRCPECRRALALLEVTGHVLRSDRSLAVLSEDFTERLVACVEPPKSQRLFHRIRLGAYVAGPLAAAAVVALAFLGVFDRPHTASTKVAGEKEIWTGSFESMEPAELDDLVEAQEVLDAADSDAADARLDEWIQQMQSRLHAGIEATRDSGESLQRALDLTVLQLLDVLEQASANQEGSAPDSSPAVSVPTGASDSPAAKRDGS